MYFNFALNLNMTLSSDDTISNNLDPDQAGHSLQTW